MFRILIAVPSRIGGSALLTGLMLVPALCLGNPLLVFTSGSEDGADAPPLLRLPLEGVISLHAISSACKLGRGGDLRVYDLATGECAEIPGPGVPAGHRPSLDQPLVGSMLEGEPVQRALDAGLFVYYDLRNSRACVVGACSRLFAGGSSPAEVRIDAFTATPRSLKTGALTKLAWRSSGATGCALSNEQDDAAEDVETNGSSLRFPLRSTTYTLTCRSSVGTANEDVAVTVAIDPDLIFLDTFERR